MKEGKFEGREAEVGVYCKRGGHIYSDSSNPFSFFLLLYYPYILRGFTKLIIAFFFVKNTLKLINQQLKNKVKIVNL